VPTTIRSEAGKDNIVLDKSQSRFYWSSSWNNFEYAVLSGTDLYVFRGKPYSYYDPSQGWNVALYYDSWILDPDNQRQKHYAFNDWIGRVDWGDQTQRCADLDDWIVRNSPTPIYGEWMPYNSQCELLDAQAASSSEKLGNLGYARGRLYDTYGEDLFPPDSAIQDAVRNALQNTRVNHGNMLTLPVELLNTVSGKEATKLANDLIRKVSNPDSPGVRKLASSIYLNGRFGSRLSGIELEGLLENSLGSNKWREKLQAKAFGISTYLKDFAGLHFTCRVGISFDYAFQGLNYLVKRWDNASLPTLSDVWDAIPYSFVVDWATGVGDRIADFEQGIYRWAMDVSNIWLTVKASSSGNLLSDSGIQEYKINVFLRRGLPILPATEYRHGPSGRATNIVDLTAMVIQA
jgi:hypothetical protein